jgi:tRNA-binding EMAP/Myf-like protein
MVLFKYTIFSEKRKIMPDKLRFFESRAMLLLFRETKSLHIIIKL